MQYLCGDAPQVNTLEAVHAATALVVVPDPTRTNGPEPGVSRATALLVESLVQDIQGSPFNRVLPLACQQAD